MNDGLEPLALSRMPRGKSVIEWLKQHGQLKKGVMADQAYRNLYGMEVLGVG